MLNEKFRLVLRHVLSFLTKATIKKHNIGIILVVGSYEPTLIKERIYSLISSQTNTRRSLEGSESEFSLPLAVFGCMEYPETYLAWIKVLLGVMAKLTYLHPYRHILVLQLRQIDTNIFNFWLKTLNPDLVVSTHPSFETEKSLRNYSLINLSSTEADKVVEGIFPERLVEEIQDEVGINLDGCSVDETHDIYSRLRVLAGKNGSIIIDSRHLYHPPKIKNVVELAETFGGKKYVFSNMESDLDRLPSDFELIKSEIPSDVDKNTVIIFRGRKDQYNDEIRLLAKTDLGI